MWKHILQCNWLLHLTYCFCIDSCYFVVSSGFFKSQVTEKQEERIIRYALLMIFFTSITHWITHILVVRTRAFRNQDIQAQLIKSVPDFCTVYVVSKVKAVAVKSAVRSPNPSSISSSRQQSQVGYLSDKPHSQQLTRLVTEILSLYSVDVSQKSGTTNWYNLYLDEREKR